MVIPIILNVASCSNGRTLPPQLARFGTDEVVLIELQGALDVEGDRQGETVGKLCIDEVAKRSTLLIGHHLLEGQLANLPKPIAVLHRSTHKDDSPDAPMDDDSPSQGGTRGDVEWNVVAVVKQKMVFSSRPMPMVGKTPAPTLDTTATKNVR